MRRTAPRTDELYNTERLSELHALFLRKKCVHGEDIIALATAVEEFIVDLFCIEPVLREKSALIRRAAAIHLCKRVFVERIAIKNYTKTIPFPDVKEKLGNHLGVLKITDFLYAERVLEWLKERDKYSVELELAAQYALYMVQSKSNAEYSDLSSQLDVSCSDFYHRAGDSGLFCLSKKLNFESLVTVNRLERDGLTVLEKSNYRSRDNFCLSDNGLNEFRSADQAGYCLICHPRKKDTCRTGITSSDGGYKHSPLGIVQKGCPLRQKISEMNKLYSEGRIIAALAVVTLDNPMCAATGHRICNDCMRACIYQKQEPVNIPGIETAILDAVLELPYGFEIYSLLARWNPLRVEQPLPLKLSGRKVLIVGSGPAGFTLAHYLLNDGHTVVMVDGVKIEPLPFKYIGRSSKGSLDNEDAQLADSENEARPSDRGEAKEQSKGSLDNEDAQLADSENEARPSDRGEAKEHDKSILDLDEILHDDGFELIKDVRELYESLDKRVVQGFGGVAEYGITVRWNKNYLKLIRLLLERRNNFRVFGGVRFGSNLTVDDCKRLGFDHIALCGGSSPSIPEIPNILARGVRFASDFLMTLQLSGAFKNDSLACLQIRMPVLVIGAGLTAVDSATEALTYYKVQVEKFAQRYDYLVSVYGASEVERSWSEEERKVGYEFLSHARNLRKVNNKTQFLKSLGGVKMVYRKRLQDSPAYKLNFEELNSALLEGVEFIEEAAPLEVLLDKCGAVNGLLCLHKGRKVAIKAKNIIIAAGTKPNTVLKDEFPLWYEKLEKNLTFFGDLDPNYAGSVVGAMASAKDKYPLITQRLLQNSLSEPARSFDGNSSGSNVLSGTQLCCNADGISHLKSHDSGTTYGDSLLNSACPGQGSVENMWSHSHLSCGNLNAVSEDPTLSTEKAATPFMEGQCNEIANMRFLKTIGQLLEAKVLKVINLSDNIFEVCIYSPLAAKNFMPGQFYKLQNFHSVFEMEPIALTGSCANKREGIISLIVIEVGISSYLCKFLKVGERVALTGPLGTPTEIPKDEKVLLIGGGLGNAVLFSVAEAMKNNDCTVFYFAGYRKLQDRFKMEMIEAFSDRVIWVCDEEQLSINRSCDLSLRCNMIEALKKYAKGEVSIPLGIGDLDRILTVGSDSLMYAVQRFVIEHKSLFKPSLKAVASINSPMQCMMKGICAQCVQRKIVNGKEEYVYTCINQDQNLEITDFAFLSQRLKQNALTEKLNYLYCKSMMEAKV